MQQVFDVDAVRAKSRELPASLRQSRAWASLRDQDRTILEMVEKGLSHRLIGQAVGLNAGTVSRRLALVRTRLQSTLARLALDPASPLPAACRETILLHAVAGMSLREIARTRRTPLATVTDHVRYGQGVARGVAGRRG